eukprot:jgi/Mesvir1/6379/Mv12114-RA.1
MLKEVSKALYAVGNEGDSAAYQTACYMAILDWHPEEFFFPESYVRDCMGNVRYNASQQERRDAVLKYTREAKDRFIQDDIVMGMAQTLRESLESSRFLNKKPH